MHKFGITFSEVEIYHSCKDDLIAKVTYSPGRND